MAFHFHIRSRRAARRHQEGGFRVTAATRDRPEPEPAAADTYLTHQSAAAETTPPARVRACAQLKLAGAAALPGLPLPEAPAGS